MKLKHVKLSLIIVVVKATHNLTTIAVPPRQQAVRKYSQPLLAENPVQQNVFEEV